MRIYFYLYSVMKLFLLIGIVFFSSHAFSQTCDVSLGSKTLYKPLQSKYTSPPKGYEAVFINHVNRHSARHLTKDVSTSAAYQLLAFADSANLLTTEGKRLYNMLVSFQKVEHPSIKNISDTGRSELKAIATRMYRNQRTVFSKNATVSVRFTKEIRTEQSADVFTDALKTLIGTRFHIETKWANDTTLRFFDRSPAYLKYEEGDWHQSLDSLATSLKAGDISQALSKRIFTQIPISKLFQTKLSQLAADLFGFGTIAPSVYKEALAQGVTQQDINFLSFFTCEETRALSQLDEAEDYLAKGPARNSLGIQTTIAAPLLADFLNTTDSFIKNKKIQARLRFAHAETIAPFAALLQLKGASEVCTDLSQLKNCWDASTIIPLSSNIQWILYKDKSNKYLVKTLLNEKEVAIAGLKIKLFPYYAWDDVRIFYKKLLQKIPAS